MTALKTRVDVAILGMRVDAPVSRQAGAGPAMTDTFSSMGSRRLSRSIRTAPTLQRTADCSSTAPTSASTWRPSVRPAFYDLETADGVTYEKIAKLHGKNVLATTVVQTCVRYDESERCRFCAIEESLDAGLTIAVKTPAQLAEVAEAAVRLDGVTSMVMTTGTSNGWDRGAKHLARCVRAIKRGGAGPPDPGPDRAAGGPAGDHGPVRGRARDRSASMWSRWTRRCAGAGCPESRA